MCSYFSDSVTYYVSMTLQLAGSIGILAAAFKFDRQCNDSQGLTLQEGNSNGLGFCYYTLLGKLFRHSKASVEQSHDPSNFHFGHLNEKRLSSCPKQ